MTLVVLAIGLVIGVVLGALGGGGAILTVPALVHLVGLAPAEAVTTSLVVVGLTAVMALAPHARRGQVRWRSGATLAVLGVIGSWAGSWASVRVDERVLMTAFSVLMLVVGALMLHRSRSADRCAEVRVVAAADGPHRRWEGLGLLIGAATVVGFLTGFLGVGGGFLIVPALTMVLAVPITDAVGTSLLVIALNSVTSLVARVGHPIGVDWRVAATLVAAASVGTWVGVRIHGRVSPHALTRAFATGLVALAVVTAASGVV